MRVNFNYFISEAVFEFILEAVDLVASEGWRLLPHYDFEPVSGLWLNRAGIAEPPMSLHDLAYDGGDLSHPVRRRTAPESALPDYLLYARHILDEADVLDDLVSGRPALTEDFEHLRWFPLPEEMGAASHAPMNPRNREHIT